MWWWDTATSYSHGAHCSYHEALVLLVDRVPPHTFVSLLPANGTVAFFLPLLVRGFRRQLQPATTNAVLKEAAELAARPPDSLW